MFNQIRKFSGQSLLLAAAIPMLFFSPTSMAQEIGASQSVKARPRPNYDPGGMQFGNLKIDAGADVGIARSDNILATSRDGEDDFLAVLEPSIRISNDWGRSALAVSAATSIGRYTDNSSEDFDDYSARLDWSRDWARAGSLRLYAGRIHDHESRRDPTDEDGFEPNTYDVDIFGMRYSRRVGALTYNASFESRAIEYQDATGPGGIINNDDRNRRENLLSLRVGSNSQRVISPFLEIGLDERDYSLAVDDFGVGRTSDGTAFGVGLQLQQFGTLSGEILLGRIERSYDDSQLSDSSRFWTRSLVEWNPTGLTTISLDIETRIDETNYADAAGVEVDRLGLTVDHELLRNVILSLGFRTEDENYISSSRDDEIFTWFAEGTVYFNRHVRISLELESIDRDSSIASRGFSESVVRIVLRSFL